MVLFSNVALQKVELERLNWIEWVFVFCACGYVAFMCMHVIKSFYHFHMPPHIILPAILWFTQQSHKRSRGECILCALWCCAISLFAKREATGYRSSDTGLFFRRKLIQVFFESTFLQILFDVMKCQQLLLLP